MTETLLIHKYTVSTITNENEKIVNRVILDLKIRPQILLNESSHMLAIFVDESMYNELIKMINSVKGNSLFDFGPIEMARLWRTLKPLIERMEIKST